MQCIFSNLRLGRYAYAITVLAFSAMCRAGECHRHDSTAKTIERPVVDVNRGADNTIRHKRAALRSDEMMLYLGYRKTKVTLCYIDVYDVWVSAHCLGRECLALVRPAVQRNPNEIVVNQPWSNNPAAVFCKQNGGEYLVAEHPNGNQDELCRFRDGSMIMGWDYYYKFYENR